MQKIVPFLWFDNRAEEAVNFYISVFKKDSRIVKITNYGDEGPGEKGTVMSIVFKLDGQEFYALNGGPIFKFSEAISFFVNCDTQIEIDELWDKLSYGGEQQPCGWLKDKYGVTWQIVPSSLGKMLNDSDVSKAQRVMKAMLEMHKLDIKILEKAYNQK